MGAARRAGRLSDDGRDSRGDREGVFRCTPKTFLNSKRLRALLGRYVRSPLGRRELQGVAPLSDRAAIETALADAAEAIEYLRAASQPQPASRGAAIRLRFDLGADPGASVARLRIEGATLEATEIFELARLLDLASEARSVLLSRARTFSAPGGACVGDRRSARAGPRSSRQDSARRHAGRRCERRAGASAARHRKAAQADPGIARTLPARASRRRNAAGRFRHHSQRPLRGAGGHGPRAARRWRDSRSERQRRTRCSSSRSRPSS